MEAKIYKLKKERKKKKSNKLKTGKAHKITCTENNLFYSITFFHVHISEIVLIL